MDSGVELDNGNDNNVSAESEFKTIRPSLLVSFTSKTGANYDIYRADPKNLRESDADGIIDGMILLNPDNKANGLRSQFDDGGYRLYYVIDEEGGMAGYATVFPVKGDSDSHKSAYLNKRHVGTDYRRQGIATKLLEMIENDYDEISLISIISDPEALTGMRANLLNRGYETDDNRKFTLKKARQ